MNETKNLISGEWVSGQGADFQSVNPSYGAVMWEGRESTPSDVEAAFAAARAAFKGWAQTPLADRLAIANRFKELAAARKDELGRLIAQETGKALWDASGEAGILGPKVDISIKSHADRTGSRDIETGFGSAALRHRPHGVMTVLGPYNFPMHLPNGQIIPALIAGNTVVFKPSEQTPACGAALAALYHEAGFPPGVINMVHGGRDTGAALLDHPELDGVLFTGAASTGAMIHKKFGGRPEIILALEMGGNNPLIGWDIDDPKAAASIIVQSAFITTGQRCTCARRLILPEGAAGDAVIAQVKTLMNKVTIGPWDEPEPVFMGPLISANIAERVAGSAAKLPGDTLVKGGMHERGGAYIRPALVDVTGQSVMDEEIFGPVLQVTRVADFDAAMAAANDTKFGLAAGLISSKAALWDEFARRIRAGVVNFNRPTTGASGALPFGGPGASGNHNPGAYYAADFCAWPMASQISETLDVVPLTGLAT